MDRVQKKLDALRDLGVDCSPLMKEISQTRRLIDKGDQRDARLAADQMLIFLKVLISDIQRTVNGFARGGKVEVFAESSSRKDQDIVDLVQEAFQRSLHSTALRRMVETIALEKVNSLLSEEFVSREEFQKALKSKEGVAGQRR
jgi:hypothetical protein